jgi:hypothetical protein
MPYLNDVFISYKRSPITEQWLNDTFLPFFIEYLDEQLPNKPIVFVDKSREKHTYVSELTPGVDFTSELFQNLVYSKCLVSIWTPNYFRKSEWCAKEYLTMRYCQEYRKPPAFKGPKTLIWPIMYRKVEPLPEAIKNIHCLDYSEYNLVGEAFTRSEKYLKFQQQLQGDILTISNIILNVPPMDQYWETKEGQRKIIKELNVYFEANGDFNIPPKQNLVSWQTIPEGS